MRHPLYVGWIAAFWATPTMTTVGRAPFAAGLTAYISIAIIVEERDLARHFGPSYIEWRDRTTMLVPRPSMRTVESHRVESQKTA
jgi:protein-S-isoprenylcysteine O-methyltransferase Ste14